MYLLFYIFSDTLIDIINIEILELGIDFVHLKIIKNVAIALMFKRVSIIIYIYII